MKFALKYVINAKHKLHTRTTFAKSENQQRPHFSPSRNGMPIFDFLCHSEKKIEMLL